MKKVFFLIVSLCLTVILTTEILAAEMVFYHLKEFNITLPETYDVLTREMEISDETMHSMKEKNIYLDAREEHGNQDICVAIKDMDIDAPQVLDDNSVEEWIPYFEEQGKESGSTVEGSEIYHHVQTSFQKMHLRCENDDGVQYVIQYNTIIAKKWICMEARFGDEPVSSEEEEKTEEIIRGMYFQIHNLMEPAGHTDAFCYRDPVTGAEFTVPEDWSQELSRGDESSHAAFFLNADPDVFVLYGATDLWESLPQGQRVGKTRASMENPFFGPGGLASELGIPSNEVSRKRYGEMEYAVGKRVEEVPNGDGEMEPAGHTTVMAGFDHGYAYYFFFPGWEDHENYRDLEAMAASMKYPEHPDSAPGSALWKNFLIAGAVLALVGIWIALRGRRERKRLVREGVVSEAYPEELRDTGRPKQSTESGRPKNCRFCGARLPGKGEFCPECGTRIEE